MTHTDFTGLLSRKKVVRYLIYLLFVCVFAVFVFKLNQVEKTELVVRTGQTFEKGKVTEILQDNLDANGTRIGEQKVRVKMLTGARKGDELDITSSSGYLFGAACKVGMKVIVMQSVAGETTIASVYTQDREWVIYIFALVKAVEYLKMPFFPSYAAFTFPFVISAIASKQTMACAANMGHPMPFLQYVVLIETIIAVALVVYTYVRFMGAIFGGKK